MDEESINNPKDVRLRQADAPTGEDKFNKEALPAIMQVCRQYVMKLERWIG